MIFSKKHLLYSLSFFVFLVVASGCSKKTTVNKPTPEKIENRIIFLEEAPSEKEWDGKKIVMKRGKRKIGFINYASVNTTFGLYVLYELYIYPEYRGKGHAKTLINYTSQRLFNMGAAKIFIQPGPFEEEDNEELSDEEYKEKLLKIVDLYKNAGFKSAPG